MDWVYEIYGLRRFGMGWKGTLRTVSAAANRMEQDAQRRHKVAANSQIAADAAYDVKKWEDHIENL